MDRTNANGSAKRTHTGADTPFSVYMRGMDDYACTTRAMALLLAKLASAIGIGIVIGVFCYFCYGTGANTVSLSADYAKARAFTSFSSLLEYAQFFGVWFLHHAVWLFAALPLSLTVYPMLGAGLLCVVRGAVAGFSVCVLSGRFSLFSVGCAMIQGALCALLAVACAKSVRYAARRRALTVGSSVQFSLPWLCGNVAPALTGILLCLMAQICGMLLVSAFCCF